MINEPNILKVSICCITYNHEPFIKKALDGFIMQETNFAFEVLIHDDASTDNTARIIREYELKYPHIIKAIYQTENQWSKGVKDNTLTNFRRAQGKYIALCEGDDYWTDPKKLQRQVDFLDNNEDYVLVSENGLVINTENNTRYYFNDMDECDVSLTELLGKRKFPTASVMFRKAAYVDAEYIVLKHSSDIILWCYLANKGKIKYLTAVSSVYMRGAHGIVLSSRNIAWANMLEEWNKVLDTILPPNINRDILNQRNYNEYKKVFYLSAKQKDSEIAVMALKKCFKFQPMSTIKMLLKFYIQKLGPTKTAVLSTK